MKSNYRISNAAIYDLNSIWIYTWENWSKKQADKYYEEIISEIKNVAKNLNTGKLLTQVRVGYQSSKIKSHVIFYKIATDNVVEVVRILHESMNWESHLD
jgi:toxin ParE1/3/4